jgi:hypothetical protein
MMSSPARFLIADRQQRGVVLRLGQPGLLQAPQFLGPHARREAAGQLGAVDQPVGLGIGSHERCR